MEELSSDVDVAMKDSDEVSVTSTIQTDHDSEEEFTIHAVLAAWEVEGSLRYLIEWEGYDLSEATWEPRENLHDDIIQEWEETKAEPGFDLYQRIREWKKAWKDTYAKKLDRHNERNRQRVRRREKPHSFEHMKGLLEWVDGFPDGDDLNASAVSSPSIADGDSDAGVGQPLRPLSEKRKIPGANPSEDRSPNVSRRNSTSSTSKLSLVRADSTASSTSHTQVTRERSNNGSAANKTSNKKPAPKNSAAEGSQDSDCANLYWQRFCGRKRKETAQTLAEAARDPAKTPKLFNYRHTRIVEKAGRDRDGAAPSKMPSNLVSLNPAERNVEASSIPNPEAGTNDSPAGDRVKRARHHDYSSQAGQKPQKTKPKKSISWGTVEKTTFQEPTEFDREHSLFLREETAPSEVPWVVKEEWAIDALPAKEPPSNPPIQPKTPSSQPNQPNNRIRGNDYVSTDKCDANPSNRTITTDVQFGPGTRETISVSFQRHEPQNDLPWPAIFENMPTLIFTHTCMIQDFQSQEKVLAADKLGNGLVVSNDGGTGLDAVANWLRARSLGALLYRHDLCILVHMQPQPQPQPQAQAQTAITVESPSLQYCLFRPAPHFTTRSLAPITLSEGPDTKKLLPQMGPAVFDRILGFQYDRLLSEEALTKPHNKHTFFLAFPKNTEPEAKFLGIWLRNCNPKCRILSSFFAGHWQSFLRLEQGTVLIHEEAIWSIRLFPNVNKLLNASSKFKFVLFSKSLQPLPMYPSLGQPCRVGDLTLQLLGGQKRAALLVTPSFVVSQPQQVWNFFKWFWKAWSDARLHYSLVVCAGFDSWLLEVAANKENAWSRLPTPRAQQDHKASVTKELEALYKTRECVRKLQDISSEEQPGLILGPDLIDSNDEQSLVNWFGWWSIMNLDQYRMFTVIASSAIDLGKIAHCTTRPSFTASSTSTVTEFQELKRANAPQMPLQEKQAAGSESRRRFDMIPDDTSVSLRNFLSSLPGKFSGRALPLKIYPFPVAYWDETTASELNVHPDDFKMYSDCIRQFKEQVAPRAYNTIVALFYTVEGKLSHRGALEDARKKRRPWIVVYRPMNLHMRYYDEAELIIWDPVGKKSCRDYAEVYEGDLADAQRTMIQQLREERDMMPLKRIWIGGWDTDQSSSIDPLDRTLQHLETLMHDWKNSAPIPVVAMRDQGWRTVERGHAPPRSRHPSPEPMDLDATAEASDTADEDLKIVFHPPRGRQPNRPTNCRNRFFQHCIHEEIRGRPKNAMEYRFEPTMEWYRHQVEEGRGFQHISFMPWEEVFAKYKIEDPKKKVRVT